MIAWILLAFQGGAWSVGAAGHVAACRGVGAVDGHAHDEGENASLELVGHDGHGCPACHALGQSGLTGSFDSADWATLETRLEVIGGPMGVEPAFAGAGAPRAPPVRGWSMDRTAA